jgi:hypothetical protein
MNHYHKRYSGKLNIHAVEDYQRVLPQMSDSQLQFLLRCASIPNRLETQRALILHEMGNRCAVIYSEN